MGPVPVTCNSPPIGAVRMTPRNVRAYPAATIERGLELQGGITTDRDASLDTTHHCGRSRLPQKATVLAHDHACSTCNVEVHTAVDLHWSAEFILCVIKLLEDHL